MLHIYIYVHIYIYTYIYTHVYILHAHINNLKPNENSFQFVGGYGVIDNFSLWIRSAECLGDWPTEQLRFMNVTIKLINMFRDQYVNIKATYKYYLILNYDIYCLTILSLAAFRLGVASQC